MQKSIYWLTVCLLSVCSTCHAQQTELQNDSLIAPAYYIDGRYYTSQLTLDKLPITAIKGMHKLPLENGASTYEIETGKGFVRPEAWNEYEIPPKRVKYLPTLEAAEKMYAQMKEATTHAATETIGDSLRDFTLQDLDGNTWTRKDFLGHVVVVNLWYSGCGPCLREMPELSIWKSLYPRVRFFSANFEKKEKIQSITTQRGFNWTHLVEDTYFVKWAKDKGFPVTLVIDKNGIIRNIVYGSDEEKHQQIKTAIEQLDK